MGARSERLAWLPCIGALALACAQPSYAGCDEPELLAPSPGELTIVQLRLGGTFKHGEAAIVVGPDGTLVLIDVGNSTHADEVRAAVRAINTACAERGFPRVRGALEVDWVILTHFHGDHVGALAPLLNGDPPLAITGAIVHRGFVDLGPAMNEGAYEALCDEVEQGAPDLALCRSETRAPCRDRDGVYPAIACELPSIPLGDARLRFVAADGFISDGEAIHALDPFGHEANNEENARSLAGVIEHGAFRYHFGGDLTGAGTDGVPDVETPLAEIAGPYFYGALGADVVHAHHHVRRTSSSQAFVDLVTPGDGRSRNVVGGIAAHFGSPHGEVLERFGERVGEGRIWITRSATGGDEHPLLIDADAAITVRTIDGGGGYEIEASRPGSPVRMRFGSVRAPSRR